MPSCGDIKGLATAHAEGALDAEARRAFEAHLGGCPGCRAWVHQLDVTARAIRSLPPPELPPELRARLLDRFDAWQAARAASEAPVPAPRATGRAGLLAWEPLLAIVGLVALLVGAARNPSRAAADWAVSAALTAGAIGLALLARRLTLRFTVLAASAAFVAAAVRGGPGDLELGGGLECLLIEAAAAAAVGGAAWLAVRRAPGSFALGPWLVAGALAGDAALQIACSAHASLPHLVTFHAGGVLVIATAALLLARRRPQAA